MYIKYIQGLCQSRLSTADYALFLVASATHIEVKVKVTLRLTGLVWSGLVWSFIIYSQTDYKMPSSRFPFHVFYPPVASVFVAAGTSLVLVFYLRGNSVMYALSREPVLLSPRRYRTVDIEPLPNNGRQL
jgi:hypothetical protein